MNSYSWLGEDLRFNADGSLIFTQGRKDSKCIVWDTKSHNKLREFKSLSSVMFQKNNFIGIINPHEEIDSLLEIIVYKTNDLSKVQHHNISLKEFEMMKVKDFEEIFILNKIVLRDKLNFKIINLISGEKEIIRTNICADEKVHLFTISKDLFFCGKNKVHCFNEISKEVKDLYALKEDDKNKELRGFVVDSINSRLFFEEISSDKEGNTISIGLKVINFKNGNILSKGLNFPVDYAFDIGLNERGIYYETSYFSKEKLSIENGGMDEYFANNKDNHKVIYWDINQNEILTLLDTTGGNQSADYHYINKSLYRISDNLIEIINFDKTVVKIDLDSNTIIKTSSRADNHNAIVLLAINGFISQNVMEKLGFKEKDSIKCIQITNSSKKTSSLLGFFNFKNVIDRFVINNDSTVVFEYFHKDLVGRKHAIFNFKSEIFINPLEFNGSSYNLSNSDFGYKISEDQNSLKSIDGFFDELPLNLKGFNRKKVYFTQDYNLLNTFDEITNFKREIVYDSLLILRDSSDTIIYESTIYNNFKGVKISKSKRFLIFEDSIKDLKTRATIYLKNALPCRQILNYGEIAANVLEDTVNNLFYIMEQVPRKKRKQKYIYFNLKELSNNKIVHSFRIKNNYREYDSDNWKDNLTLGQDFNIDLKNKLIYLNEIYKNNFFNCYDFNSPDPLWSFNGFEFFKLDSDGNILAKKEHGLNNSEFLKVNSQTRDILFKREFNVMNDFVTFLDDPKNNQILIYRNRGSIISLDRIKGEINSNYNIEGIARNKSANNLLVKFLITNGLLISDGLDESTQIRRSSDGKLLYSFYDIPTLNTNKESTDRYVNNRLFVDTNYRFDGTPGAIEKLYFVCGLEVVELNQIKDSLYVPNLVQRIMNGENLDHLPKLSELNICGVTPVVEPLENDKSGNQGYRIIPRSGGVGDVDVYINGVVRLSTNTKKLKRKDGNYMLYVEKELLELYQIPGEELKVKVIAKTANNSISSRGVVIDIESDEKTTFKKPSLHAIMIGVDDYKGDGLDLNYAAKDANDLQVVLQKSAQKFFNIDDTSRVHFYNLTVNRSGANGNEKIKGITPDRTNIINTIAEIEKTSKPEDILLLFFAGHGEIVDKDQLLLLTSESSKEDFKGLRMRELLELLNKVPAGKRVLILDACHSGAAINNMDMAQLTGKRDVKDAERQSQRLKELDKLASKSGFAIITASSSDQKALELPQYEHGLMTYALLNSMLNNKNALDEDNKLQLEKWLMATEEEVKKLNQNQSAERMVPINFTLGKVDDEVRSSIVLKEIPLVYIKNVINTDLAYDNLEIESKLNEYFSNRTRGGDKSLLLASVDQTNATLINVLYKKEKNAVNLKITILKNNQVNKQFTKTGAEAQLNDLIKEIALEIEAGVK